MLRPDGRKSNRAQPQMRCGQGGVAACAFDVGGWQASLWCAVLAGAFVGGVPVQGNAQAAPSGTASAKLDKPVARAITGRPKKAVLIYGLGTVAVNSDRRTGTFATDDGTALGSWDCGVSLR